MGMIEHPVCRVLVVDDDAFVCRVVEKLLEVQGFSLEFAGTGREAEQAVAKGFRGGVILDRFLPDVDGTELFPKLHGLCPENPVIFLTGHGSLDLAVDSIRGGAFEFLDKSELAERLLPSVIAAARHYFESDLSGDGGSGSSTKILFPEIITRSREMQAVFRTIRNALDSRVTVLIQGESGTGKELIARAVHQYSRRVKFPFVAINCAGIPEHLLEAEIFGYERGAFTGAVSRKPGKFELAQNGTLMLDEIGEMHPALQAKILRVIQEGEYQRLGGVETLKADVRILSATHRNLEHDIDLGRFRSDLYYRLAVFTIFLPPLRERKGDISLLSQHFLELFAEREGKEARKIDSRAMALLESYSFPGNVRELENIISYAVISSRGEVITIADFPPNFLRGVSDRRKAKMSEDKLVFDMPGPPMVYVPKPKKSVEIKPKTESASEGLRDLYEGVSGVEGEWVAPPSSGLAYGEENRESPFPSLADVEAQHIARALLKTGGNKAEAARILGISRVTLYRKISTVEA